jgi:tetratricopeptide (TPR) repeat protein
MSSSNNFIDQTFSIIASGILQLIPASNLDRRAFISYREGLNAQSAGQYAVALNHYTCSLRLETDVYDRSYILYNIGLIYANNGAYNRAIEYYIEALARNPYLAQALNNIAVIYHTRAQQAIEQNEWIISFGLFRRAISYWNEALRIAPNNYIEARNWINSVTKNG